jgi:hypothetical protein
MSFSAEQPFYIAGPAGRLEAIWCPSTPKNTVVAVICHPHPLHGGTMGNKVVTTLVRTWRDKGVATLRFNFRGTGNSEGVHDQGVGEIDDLLAVLRWLLVEQGMKTLDLAGFSFGAWVSAAASARVPQGLFLRRLVLVAPPVQYAGFAALQLPPQTLVMQGDADDVVDPAAVFAWAASRTNVPELVRFPDAGHFFHGRLGGLKAELAARL